MREPKSLAEWLKSQGSPKYHIADGENGLMVMAIEDKKTLSPSITLYTFKETDLPNGQKYFWISSGWCVRKEFLPAIKGLMNELEKEELPKDKFIIFEVIEWRDDEDGEYERSIGVINAVSEYHASILLKNRIKSGKFPKGAWLEYTLNGKKIELDIKGRIPVDKGCRYDI
jgi:hypothetical protein